MPRRRENVECVHCGRFHPQYYGAALKNHARVHQNRREAAQRQREPSTKTEDDSISVPHVAGLVQRVRRLKQEQLTADNVAQKLLDIWGDDDGKLELLRRLMNPDLPPGAQLPSEQGANSLLATARNVILTLIGPLVQAGVMTPTYFEPGPLEDPIWPEQELCDYPIHSSLARSSIGLALLRDDARAVEMLVALETNPNGMLFCGYSILAVAILTSAREVLHYLLSLGDKIHVDQKANAYGEQEETAITLAWKVGNMELFRKLFTHNEGVPGRSLFCICAYEPHNVLDEVLQLGWDGGRFLRAQHPRSKETPLHAAVLNPDHAVLDTVMQLAAQVGDSEGDTYPQYLRLRNGQSQTPLMYAIEHRRSRSIVALLHDPDTDVNDRAWGGQTALWYAARNRDLGLVHMLLLAGCDAGNPLPLQFPTKGTPLNALLYAYEDVLHEYTHEILGGVYGAHRRFSQGKREIIELARTLLAHGCQSNVGDDRWRMPMTERLQLFPEWGALFM
ncbi:ankyrin repeat-containing domain protein [Aspergillus pseudonomiae]|uniref:Ankyrin repeat-containing domain protein n=1 Tax=Aspergillus pseudonomiae TaxID=1506151 RepID=A0A5N7DA06_9EURO|nr:ankyrin repeat-containing domain protein [Aspergillus pseudonomiae]KAE8403300.1 ankyrin repeat-containing domain protein [Aspergillus pseudonomiae]